MPPLQAGLGESVTVYADKGYSSAENRQHLQQHRLRDGIMDKACAKIPQRPAIENPLCGGTEFWHLAPQVSLRAGDVFWSAQSEGTKLFESAVFEPTEGSEQA